MEWFYQHFAQPASAFIGFVSDLIPINIGLILLVLALALCLGFLLALLKKRWKLALCLLPAPILVFNAATIQIATGLILWPSWFRDIKTPLLSQEFPLTENQKTALLQMALKNINTPFSVTEWNELSQEELLSDANQSLNTLLSTLGYSKGRTVRQIKDFHEPFFSLGLAYGGPAYKDPYTQEVVIPNPSRYPASRYWHWHTVYHEVAHAKGWLNELDTTFLQVASMIRSRYATVRTLGWMHLILNSDIYGGKSETELLALGLPAVVLTDIYEGRDKVQKLLKQKPLYQGLNKLLKKAQLQNSGKKYGLDPDRWLNNPLNGMLFRLLAEGHLRYPE